jgi:hypothetical protein
MDTRGSTGKELGELLAGGMQYVSRPPHPGLRGLIEQYYSARVGPRGPAAQAWRDLPGRTIRLMVSLGPDVELSATPTHAAPGRYGSFLTGLATGPKTFRQAPGTHYLVTEFTPLGDSDGLRWPRSDGLWWPHRGGGVRWCDGPIWPHPGLPQELRLVTVR